MVNLILNTSSSLEACYLDSKFGKLIVVTYSDFICLLEFTTCKKINTKLERTELYMQNHLGLRKSSINTILRPNEPMRFLIEELEQYSNCAYLFKSKINLLGTNFQQQVWQSLLSLQYGENISYSKLAYRINKPNSVRAVASAVSANPIVIIVPCHRIINANGSLGGYSSDIATKKSLIEWESNNKSELR